MRFVVDVAPRFDYARAHHDVALTEHGALFRTPALGLSLSTCHPLEVVDGGDVRAHFSVSAGETATFVLDCVEPGEMPVSYPDVDVAAEFDATVAFWRGWLRRSRYSGRWREMVHRSALTLKLLTYAPTGAIVAAPTTSLPEQLGGARNWDYRYTWMRDAAFTLYALLRLGFTEEAGAFMNWLQGRFRYADRESGPLQIMYGIDGREDLPEEELTHLEGYRGSAPVRIGNGAATQLQLDIYGELMDSVYLCNKFGLPIYHDGWMDLTRNLEWLIDHWDQSDEGIWEARGGRRNYTYSRLMSWVAVEHAIRIARQRGLPADITRWAEVRDRIYHQIMERGWNPAAAGVRPALRQRRARRLATAHAVVQVHRAHRPALDLHARCHHRRVGLRQPRLPLQRSRVTGRAGGRGGDVLDVLVLVGRGPRPGRPPGRGAAGLREDAHLRKPRRALLGGDRADG